MISPVSTTGSAVFYLWQNHHLSICHPQAKGKQNQNDISCRWRPTVMYSDVCISCSLLCLKRTSLSLHCSQFVFFISLLKYWKSICSYSISLFLEQTAGLLIFFSFSLLLVFFCSGTQHKWVSHFPPINKCLFLPGKHGCGQLLGWWLTGFSLIFFVFFHTEPHIDPKEPVKRWSHWLSYWTHINHFHFFCNNGL